ncbi:unnamed protein product [Coregonus sp. 'balchen']|nr:unnamed protein product [Coregonus sp. 'balchen']
MFRSACSPSAEEAKQGKREGKGHVSGFPSSDPPEGTEMGSQPLETSTDQSQSLKSCEFSAVQSNSRLELLVPPPLKSRKKHKPKMEPSIIYAPVLPSVAIGNHGLEPDSECVPPTDNTQANLRSDLKQISVSHTSSDLSLSHSPSMHSPYSPSTVHINRQPLPVTHGSYLCCSPVAQVYDPYPTRIRPTKRRQCRRKDLRGLKLTVKGVSPLSMRHKRHSRRWCNIQFWCQAWRKWGHRKWRRARCLLWVSMIRAKRLEKTRRFLLSIANTQTSNKYTGELEGSQKWKKVGEGREVVTTAIGCDGQGLDSAEDSQASKGVLGPEGVSVCGHISSVWQPCRGGGPGHIVMKYQAVLAHRLMPAFRVVYNKHALTLEDLSTLDHQNWLNDQVMNMYGELIMESAQHKVHFFNSFFHRQLMTKGYEGVKRWTKKVDLFSKALLLVPIHLEIHWCLVTVDTASKRIHLYDSQGIVFKEAAENVLRYIKTEARERMQTAFQSGWKMYINERIPQQTNENDCGVFVLEYCRCLALGKPLQFSQGDMPTVRKRIYRELCECKLQELQN